MLYSEEHHQAFQGMSSNITGNVLKHSGKCPILQGVSPVFRRMLENIQGNVAKHFRECPQIFP